MTSESMSNEALLMRAVMRVRTNCKDDVLFQQSITTDAQIKELISGGGSSLQLLAKACELFAQRPAIGYRHAEPVVDSQSGLMTIEHQKSFTTISYAQLWQTIAQIATGLANGHQIGPGRRVGICGYAHLDYILADFSCLYLGATSVPLHSHVATPDFVSIVNDSAVDTLFVDVESVGALLTVMPGFTKPCSIVVMNLDARDELSKANFNQIRQKLLAIKPDFNIETLFELLARSAQLPMKAMDANSQDPERLVSIMYTSGSTGSPKGALITEKIWFGYHRLSTLKFWDGVPYTWVNFMPFNHVMGRTGVIRGMVLGGLTYLTHRPDMSTLIEDIQLARPTALTLVPRVAVMIYQHFQLQLSHLTQAGQADASGQLMAQMRGQFLGDRLMMATTGSAPLSQEHADFIKNCFEIPLFDNYGSTEAGLITLNNQIRRENIIDYKLVDVPDLSYLGTDKPYPRGELRVKCRLGVTGYLNDQAASGALFDEDGFMKTGDIVEQQGTDQVVWIDRMKNVIKLAQGEFINTWHLESVYAGSCPAIEQIYLYGDSLRSYLVAVVVPSHELIQEYHLEEPAALEELRLFVRKEIQRIASEHKLRGYEIPRDFVLETEPFSRENGLLTESNKSVHRKLKERYGEMLAELYVRIESGQIDGMSDEALPPDQLVMSSIKAVLGFAPTSLEVNFVEMGGDSMDSVRLSGLIQQRSGVTLPVSMILSPSTTLAHWVAYLTKSLHNSGSDDKTIFEKLHGREPALVYAKDLQLERIFTPSEMADASALAPFAVGEKAKNILLTGANGFLGRFLLGSFLEKLPADGKLYCLVRAANPEMARERLFKGFAVTVADQAYIEKMSQDKRLVVLAGDLTLEHFGIGAELYAELVQNVDTIFHNGALVNHAFTYQQLFEPNVVGTIEMIRLALQGRLKKINFVSSVGVGAGLDRGDEMVMENEDIRQMWPVRSLAPGYAAGYATSKWAAEVLLSEFSERFNVPVNTYRCGMILAHTQRRGHINAADFFSRWMMGLVNAGAAPHSFYCDAATAQIAHFGGLPVDFIAAGMSDIAIHGSVGYTTYHVVNPHWDNPVSLDTVASWMRSAGYPLMSMPSHQQWYKFFEHKLTALDEQRRAASPLPIIYQWSQPLSGREEIRLDATEFVGRLRMLAADREQELQVPNLSESFIHKCLRDLQLLDLIDTPPMDDEAIVVDMRCKGKESELSL